MSANEVEIEYCVPCGLLPQAEKAGHVLLSTYGESIRGLQFRPSHGGVFRISVDGEKVFDKASGEGFDMDTVVARVGDRLTAKPTIQLGRDG